MIHIVKATTEDIPVIRQLAEQAFPDTYREILSPEQIDYMMEWMYSAESLHRQMEEEGHTYYIARVDGEPAGYVSIRQEGEHTFHLEKIYILVAYKGRHLGRMLFEQALKAIKELHPGPCTMQLNVNRQNPALGFYKHMGMKKADEGDFPIGQGYYMNDYIMSIDL